MSKWSEPRLPLSISMIVCWPYLACLRSITLDTLNQAAALMLPLLPHTFYT